MHLCPAFWRASSGRWRQRLNTCFISLSPSDETVTCHQPKCKLQIAIITSQYRGSDITAGDMFRRNCIQCLLNIIAVTDSVLGFFPPMTSVNFRTMTSPSGTEWCSVDQPTTVVQLACGPVQLQEKRCASKCAIDGCCLLYQFKVNSYLCELFEYTTTNFSVIPSCSSRSITMSESLEIG
jgi:hypothetical protein